MTIKDAIKQLEKGYNLTNFQVAELLKDYESNSGGNTDTVSVYKISVDDISFSWSKLIQFDAIQLDLGEEVGNITMFKGMNEGTGEVAFYAQISQEAQIIITFVKEEGDIAVVKTVDLFNYQKLADIIDGAGDSYTGLSTRGAKNYLVRKADLVNGLVPAEQLPSYVDDVVNFNGSTIDIISEDTENSILEYGQNTIWIGNSSVEPYRSKYYQKLIYVNANTSKEDWVIKDPEEGKIYVNIGPNGESTTGDTYRWSGKAWVNLNQNLNAKIDALNATVKEVNLGDAIDIYNLESLPHTTVLAIWDALASDASHIEFTYSAPNHSRFKIITQSINYTDKTISLILPNGQVDTYVMSGVHPDNLSLVKQSSTGRVVTLKEKDLNRTYLGSSIRVDIINASKLVVETSSAGIKEFIRGAVSGEVINFLNINSDVGAQLITYNTSNGKLSSMVYKSYASSALFYGDYKSAGGSLSKSELNTFLADASNLKVATIPDNLLGTTITDTNLKSKLIDAGILIITRSNDYQIILKSSGYTVNEVHSFVGADTPTTFRQINYNIRTGKISSLINMNNTAYSEYLNTGGLLSESVFNEWYKQAPSESVYVVESSKIGGTALTDDEITRLKTSSKLVVVRLDGSNPTVLFPVGNNNWADNTTKSWIGLYNSSLFVVVKFDPTSKTLNYMNTQEIQDSKGGYRNYVAAGGSKPIEFYNQQILGLVNIGCLGALRSSINVELPEYYNELVKGVSLVTIVDNTTGKAPVSYLRTSTANDAYIWYGWLNASTVERLSYDTSTRKFTLTNMLIGKDSLDSRIMNLSYSQLGTTVNDVTGQEIKSSSAIVLTTPDVNESYNRVMFTRSSTSATEIKFVNPTISGNSYTVEYITYNPQTNELSTINV